MKKTSQKVPSFALALIAIVAPILAAGITPSFAEEPEVPSTDPVMRQSSYTGYDLFDPAKYLLKRRMHEAAPEQQSSTSSSAASEATVSPCGTSASASSVSVKKQLTMGDLTSTERDTLRKQLRNRACPQEADSDYKALCERMLKQLPARESLDGLKNPNQP